MLLKLSLASNLHCLEAPMVVRMIMLISEKATMQTLKTMLVALCKNWKWKKDFAARVWWNNLLWKSSRFLSPSELWFSVDVAVWFALKHCFQSRGGWKLSKGKVFCCEMLIQQMQNLPCESIVLAGISFWVKTIGLNCLKSWNRRPLLVGNKLLKVPFEMEDFSFYLNTLFPFSSLGGPHHLFDDSNSLSACMRNQRTISRWWRITSSPSNSLCGCVAHHTGCLGWQRPGWGVMAPTCRRAGAALPLGFGTHSWIAYGLPVSSSHCLAVEASGLLCGEQWAGATQASRVWSHFALCAW